MATIRVSFLLGGKRFHGRLNRFSVLSDVPAKATCVNRAGPGYKVIRLRRLSHTRQYRTDQGAFLRRPAGERRSRRAYSEHGSHSLARRTPSGVSDDNPASWNARPALTRSQRPALLVMLSSDVGPSTNN